MTSRKADVLRMKKRRRPKLYYYYYYYYYYYIILRILFTYTDMQYVEYKIMKSYTEARREIRHHDWIEVKVKLPLKMCLLLN